jgi:hypothetical protein
VALLVFCSTVIKWQQQLQQFFYGFTPFTITRLIKLVLSIGLKWLPACIILRHRWSLEINCPLIDNGNNCQSFLSAYGEYFLDCFWWVLSNFEINRKYIYVYSLFKCVIARDNILVCIRFCQFIQRDTLRLFTADDLWHFVEIRCRYVAKFDFLNSLQDSTQ